MGCFFFWPPMVPHHTRTWRHHRFYFAAAKTPPFLISVDYHASTPVTSLLCAELFCDVNRLGSPERTTFLFGVSAPPSHSPQPPSHPSARPKMFCWLINSGSLQTSSYDGLSGQELVTEPDLTPAFVWAWPLSWLLNERWRDEPLKNPS